MQVALNRLLQAKEVEFGFCIVGCFLFVLFYFIDLSCFQWNGNTHSFLLESVRMIMVSLVLKYAFFFFPHMKKVNPPLINICIV